MDYTEEDSDREDISGEESSSDEWKVGPGDEDSGEEGLGELEEAPVKARKNFWKERFRKFPDTDAEEDEEEDIREKRREMKIILHNLIEEALAREPEVDPRVWIADAEDDKLMKEEVIGPIMKKSSLYCNFGPHDKQRVRDQVKLGNMFKGEEGKALNEYAKTAQMYYKGLERWLGLYQMELRTTNPDHLVEGCLKLRQFYAFRQPHFLELPLNIEQQMELINSANNVQNTHLGLRELVHSVAVFLGQEKGKVLFERKTQKEAEMDEVDFRDSSRKLHAFEIQHTSNILELLSKHKPFKKYRGRIVSEANKRADYRAVFEGDYVPDPSESVPRYIVSQESRDLYKELIYLAENKVVVSSHKMPKLTRDFIKRLIVKGCYRVHVFNRFQRDHYLKALNYGPCRYPNKAVTKATDGEKVYQDEEGREFSVLAHPHLSQAELENISEDDELLTLSGIAVKIEKHKTGGRYPCWMWFSTWNQAYLKAYEEISVNYMEKNKILFNNSTPFFIDSKVNASQDYMFVFMSVCLFGCLCVTDSLRCLKMA